MTFVIWRLPWFSSGRVLSGTESGFPFLQTPNKIFKTFQKCFRNPWSLALNFLISLRNGRCNIIVSVFLLCGFGLTMAVLGESPTWSDKTVSVVWFCGIFCMLVESSRLLSPDAPVVVIVGVALKFGGKSGISPASDLRRGARFNQIFVQILKSRDTKVYPRNHYIFSSVEGQESKSSRPEVFCKKVVFEIFAKFTGKHLCQSLRPATLWKKRHRHRCFLRILRNFQGHLFLQNTSGGCFWGSHCLKAHRNCRLILRWVFYQFLS